MEGGSSGATVQTLDFVFLNVCFINLLLSLTESTFQLQLIECCCVSLPFSVSLSLTLAMKMTGSSSHAPFHRLGNIDFQRNY